MFREIGLDDEQMHQWHKLFETKHPDGHKGFLEWLGIPAEKIEKIRADSR
jgi:hypothetical protein